MTFKDSLRMVASGRLWGVGDKMKPKIKGVKPGNNKTTISVRKENPTSNNVTLVECDACKHLFYSTHITYRLCPYCGREITQRMI